MRTWRDFVRIPIAIVVVIGIVAAYLATRHSTSGPSYRLTNASFDTVTSVISGVGTLTPTNSVVVVPPISGNVASVGVTVGQSVRSGQTIASITPSASASQAVATAQAALAVAQATLSDAEASTTTTTAPTTTTTVASGTNTALKTAQQAYQALCTGPAATTSNASACANLNQSLQQLERAQTSSSSGSGPAQGQGQGSNSAAPTTVSATQITADEATVTSDQQALTLAQQDVAGTITAPTSGVVAAISMTVGSSVRTQSTTETITIIDPSSIEVVLPVSTTQATEVHNGDAVVLSLEGRSTIYHAKVTSIGTTPTTNQTTGVTTVSVTALLDSKSIANFDGALADTTITTAHQQHALSVPTSALTNTGGNYSVTVMRAGRPTQVAVKVGTIGATRTEITSGLTAGEQIVLANLNKPLPTAQSTFGVGATGGFRARFAARAAAGGFAGTPGGTRRVTFGG